MESNKHKKGADNLDKHSGTGIDKQSKKEGAGGKYTWGNPKDDIKEKEIKPDKNDPLYDEDEEEKKK